MAPRACALDVAFVYFDRIEADQKLGSPIREVFCGTGWVKGDQGVIVTNCRRLEGFQATKVREKITWQICDNDYSESTSSFPSPSVGSVVRRSQYLRSEPLEYMHHI